MEQKPNVMMPTRNLMYGSQLKFWLNDVQLERFKAAVPSQRRSAFLRDVLDAALKRCASKGRSQRDADEAT